MLSGESDSNIENSSSQKYDVVIAGGGIAGVSAALAASRNGAKTLLIERTYLLGGLATAGLVTIYLPLCDGRGRQVSFGIAEELLRVSIQHGYEPSFDSVNDCNSPCWLNGGMLEEKTKNRYQFQFNANLAAILFERLLTDNGVDILYGTYICDSTVKENYITALLVENKSGRSAVAADSFVDATGDADVCHVCGENTVNFKQGNVIASWYYEYSENAYRLKPVGAADIPDKYKTNQPDTVGTRYGGLDAKELSDMMRASHSGILADFLKKGGITEGHALGTIATIPQIRMTRRVDGAYTLDDIEQHKRCDDSIGMIGDWRKPGPIYEIPFGCLHGRKIKNLITAGRCISVTDAMWDISRVIPACAVTGQAAGTAAALSRNIYGLAVDKLQDSLKKQGVLLHIEELQ